MTAVAGGAPAAIAPADTVDPAIATAAAPAVAVAGAIAPPAGPAGAVRPTPPAEEHSTNQRLMFLMLIGRVRELGTFGRFAQ
jgi:hypothetical protein